MSMTPDDVVDFDSAVAYLREQPQLVEQTLAIPKVSEFLAATHHGLGTWLRNNFGFWLDGSNGRPKSLAWESFFRLGVGHADDMSGLVLARFHREVHGGTWADDDTRAMVAGYQAHWRERLIDDDN